MLSQTFIDKVGDIISDAMQKFDPTGKITEDLRWVQRFDDDDEPEELYTEIWTWDMDHISFTHSKQGLTRTYVHWQFDTESEQDMEKSIAIMNFITEVNKTANFPDTWND